MAASSSEKATSPTIVGHAGWRFFRYETVASTNDLARNLLPWSAVRAVAQTAGRGRFGRSFVSDPGGLWLSATLPAEGAADRWSGFSLMVGCRLLRVLETLAVPDARLRWPNDLMSAKKKLAGLLIEQGSRHTLTVGIGMNVQNAPWQHDSSLADTSTRLADLLPVIPEIDRLAALILDALADAHRETLEGGLSKAVREINAHWTTERPILVTLIAGETIEGRFLGLDQNANLRILDTSERERLVAHHHVAQLKELA
jgi:BirA family transcriptional regulator, biotin operon repressor / biotin---[acetyl-CoA-carboxylase] ligase